MKRLGFLSIALAAVMAVGCDSKTHRDTADTHTAAANPTAVGTSGAADSNKVSNSDRDFVQELAIAGMAEVELGKMAMERGANAEVKKFGQMMVKDHTAAGDKLEAVAAQHNIPMPTALDDKHRDLRDKLAMQTGPAFDRDYISAMVDGHEAVLDKLGSRVDKADLAKWKTETTERISGKKVTERVQATTIMPEKSDNPVTMSINQWAAEAYPTVQAHLEAAKRIESAIKRRSTN
jgi:putative membrane protein